MHTDIFTIFSLSRFEFCQCQVPSYRPSSPLGVYIKALDATWGAYLPEDQFLSDLISRQFYQRPQLDCVKQKNHLDNIQ